MRADELRNTVLTIVAKHAIAAQASQYDRTVSITAVAAARSIVEEILPDIPPQDYGDRVLGALRLLQQTYNDPDGEYTNGRGVVGSLLSDVEAGIRKAGLK